MFPVRQEGKWKFLIVLFNAPHRSLTDAEKETLAATDLLKNMIKQGFSGKGSGQHGAKIIAQGVNFHELSGAWLWKRYQFSSSLVCRLIVNILANTDRTTKIIEWSAHRPVAYYYKLWMLDARWNPFNVDMKIYKDHIGFYATLYLEVSKPVRTTCDFTRLYKNWYPEV